MENKKAYTAPQMEVIEFVYADRTDDDGTQGMFVPSGVDPTNGQH